MDFNFWLKRQIFRPRKRLKTSCRWGVASNQVFHQIDAPFFWGLLGSEIDKAPVERLSFSLHRFWHAAYVFLGVLIVLVKAQQSSILFFHLLKDICLLSPVGFPGCLSLPQVFWAQAKFRDHWHKMHQSMDGVATSGIFPWVEVTPSPNDAQSSFSSFSKLHPKPSCCFLRGIPARGPLTLLGFDVALARRIPGFLSDFSWVCLSKAHATAPFFAPSKLDFSTPVLF